MLACAFVACAVALVGPTLARAVTVGGVDPAVEPIPGASYGCYAEARGDDYSAPAFVLEILPGRRYRTPAGEGSFTVTPGEILAISWTSGPLLGEGGEPAFVGSAARWDDWGQTISVNAVGDARTDFTCAQRPAREQAWLVDLRHKDPQPGTYRCFARDASGAALPDLVVQPGRQYAVGGSGGTYAVDVLGDHEDDFGTVTWQTGPLADAITFYWEDPGTGLRRFRVSGTPDQECGAVGPRSARARYGAAKAPRPPKPGVALSGLYATWTIDVTGICGGLCWTFRTFQPGGRVFTREPETGPKDARCERTLPNGLPLCEAYRVAGGTIRIGDAKPVSFARVKQGLRIDGDLYRPVALPKGLRLAGRYESTSFVPATGGQQGGIVLQRAFTFTGDRFTREGFAGASLVATDTGTPFGDPVAGITTASSSANRGTYRFPSPGTIELRYDDGTRERLFFFLPDGPGATPKAIHVGGDDYVRDGG